MNFSGTLKVNKFACFSLLFVIFLIIYWQTGASSYPQDKDDFVNLKELLKAAIYATERGGGKVTAGKDNKLDVKSKGKTQEGIDDPVTNVDYASHCAMFYSLKMTFPKVTVVSEEHDNRHDSDCQNQEILDVDRTPTNHRVIDYLMDEHVYARDVAIWIDPLDATKEYTEGLYQYVTTMACVAVRGVPIIGVIHYPFTQTTYWGWVTKRASSNIAHQAHNEENKHAPRVTVSRSHPGAVAAVAKEAFGPKTSVTAAAGAGYKVMAVVNGTFDVYLHTTVIKKWDLCAGDAIVRTVDGKMTTAKGEPVDYAPTSPVKVSDGVLVTLHDHDYYLSRMPKIMAAV